MYTSKFACFTQNVIVMASDKTVVLLGPEGELNLLDLSWISQPVHV